MTLTPRARVAALFDLTREVNTLLNAAQPLTAGSAGGHRGVLSAHCWAMCWACCPKAAQSNRRGSGLAPVL